MALQGTLEDFGIADIFQLIGQQQKTGLLVLSRKDNTIQIAFREGFIVSAEVQHRDKPERLGQMLVGAGLCSRDQIQKALEQQKKTLLKLGAILVENGILKKTDLDEFIYLQTKETIFKLFRWNSGDYQFIPQDVQPEVDSFQPISAEHILMDGFRIIDEWPAIRKKIGSFSAIYDRVSGMEVPSGSNLGLGVDLDSDIDAAFSEFEGGDSKPEEDETFSPNVKKVFDLIDGEKDVRSLIARSRLGEFEACHALAQLIDQGYAEQIRKISSALESGKEKLKIDLYQDVEEVKKSFSFLFDNVVFILTYLVVGVLILSLLGVGPFKYLFHSGRQRIERKFFSNFKSDYQMDRIRTALEIYFLERSFYPGELEELVKLDLLESSDLNYPWKKPYTYRSDGASFSLDKPL